MDLSRRLGNRLGVLPHTVILDAQGRKFSKRDASVTLRELRAKGVSAKGIRARLDI